MHPNSEPSTFERHVENALTWVRDHQERFWTVVGVVALSALLGFFVFQQRQHRQEDAWAQLGSVQGALMQNQFDTARKALEDWQKAYAGSSAGDYARFLQADLLYKTGDYAAAAQVYEALARTGRPAIVQPLALSGEISALEMAGKIPEARATAQRFVDAYPDHFFAASAYLSLARLAERAGDTAAAAAVYERFVILYPQSPWTTSIRARLQTFSSSAPVAK